MAAAVVTNENASVPELHESLRVYWQVYHRRMAAQQPQLPHDPQIPHLLTGWQ